MRLVDAIEIRGAASRRIELWQGDLTKFNSSERVDALVVSAFPNDYTPTSDSVIGDLAASGISVKGLARDKDIDIRSAYSCWLSKPIDPIGSGFLFSRILGFEPWPRGEPPELVGDIFRALTPILVVRPEIRSVAMPIVAAGNMRYPVSEMLSPILDAAIHWLEIGLPLDRLAIVAHSDAKAKEASAIFAAAKAAYVAPAVSEPADADFDIFISYAHANAPTVDVLVDLLQNRRSDIRIFIDHHDLNVGAPWQLQIFESLERSKKVVALLSPEYVASKACKEEFSIAWIRGDQVGKQLLFPILAFSAKLPAFMSFMQYADAREGDVDKLRQAALMLLRDFSGD